MSTTRSFRSRLAALALVAAVLLPAAAGRADDSVLFSTTGVAPNVLIFLDNSGSMNNISWHTNFLLGNTYSCNQAAYGVWNPSTNANGAFNPADTYYIDTSNKFYYINGSGNKVQSGTSTRTHCGKTHTVPMDPLAEGGQTRYEGAYLNWLFSTEADASWTDISSNTNGVPSVCIGGANYAKYKRTRMNTAKQILKEVVCEINVIGGVRVGLAVFRDESDPNGGYVMEPIDLISGAQLGDLVTAINSVEADTWTPLGETLFQLYTYFMPRTTTNLPKGKDGVTKFPRYEYKFGTSANGGDHSSTSSNWPPDPIQYKCQKNFVIIVTDGEPTKDDFDTGGAPTGTDAGFSNFKSKLIGDYNADGETEEGAPDEGAFYLDDIALFMETNDFRPDLDGTQTIDTYTIGFTTNTVANALLNKTAQVGNGIYLTSNNSDELSNAIVEAVTDIIEKSQSFTAATVPASRTADGEQLYVSLFTPASGTPYWAGHLRAYRLTGAGDIQDANGNCAIDDPSGQCFSGPFLPVDEAPPFWDAADEMPNPMATTGGRELRVSVLRGTTPAPQMNEFRYDANTPALTGVNTADLGVTYPGSPAPLGSVATNVTQYTKEIIASVRGCRFGTGDNGFACVLREGQLPDIFHSNPVVVGQPVLFESDQSYKNGFKGLVANRERVIYAGSNGGFLHGFDAGTWQASDTPPQYDQGTGAEVFGFMPWPARQKIRFKPGDTGNRDYYYVDGSPSVADAWLYSNYTVDTKNTDGSEWRTVLVGGMRQGGEAYFALDVTHPGALGCDAPASGDGYPCYLWEFPKENDGAAYQNWVAQTWGDAILTKVRVQVGTSVMERWVAVVSGGYHPSSDPNEHAAYVPSATEGRSIWVLDLKTGKPLAYKKFDTAGDCTNPANVVNNTPERQMCFSLAATPAVYDTDGDGFADLIYAGDLGGNVWKWVIKAPLNLSAATTASQPATDWPFRKWFSAPIYTSGGNKYYKSFYFPPAGTRKNGKIWLAFGSGERNDLLYTSSSTTTDDNNRFYVVEETDLYEALATPNALVTESNLTDLTSNNTCASLGSTRGYFIVGAEGEKWVTNVEIFVGYVIANSFKIVTVSSDPCDISGVSYLWAFRVDCGQGLFTDASGNATRKQDIGAGLPTDPRVTVGAAGDVTNRVIISKQGGDIINIGAPPGFPTSGSFYWRELTQ